MLNIKKRDTLYEALYDELLMKEEEKQWLQAEVWTPSGPRRSPDTEPRVWSIDTKAVTQ